METQGKFFTLTKKCPGPLGCPRVWDSFPKSITGVVPCCCSLFHSDLSQFLTASLWISANSLVMFQDPTQSKAIGAEARRKNGTNLWIHFDLLIPVRKSQVSLLLKSSLSIDGGLPSPQKETGIMFLSWQTTSALPSSGWFSWAEVWGEQKA